MNGSRLGRLKSILLGLLTCWLSLVKVAAHDAPTSFIDLRVSPKGIDASVTASNTDLAHELPSVEPDMLLQPAVIEVQRDALTAAVQSRLQIVVAGKSQRAELRKVVSLPEKRDLRLDFHYSWSAVPSSFAVQCRLFPYDPRHRTFLNIYQNGQLEQQQIFEGEKSSSEYLTGSGQSVGDVVRQFLFEGVHHIFIGPDHILFVVGLLLLGGGVGRLLKIVTAFTFAHSITLGLATFHIVSPPAFSDRAGDRTQHRLRRRERVLGNEATRSAAALRILLWPHSRLRVCQCFAGNDAPAPGSRVVAFCLQRRRRDRPGLHRSRCRANARAPPPS